MNFYSSFKKFFSYICPEIVFRKNLFLNTWNMWKYFASFHLFTVTFKLVHPKKLAIFFSGYIITSYIAKMKS